MEVAKKFVIAAKNANSTTGKKAIKNSVTNLQEHLWNAPTAMTKNNRASSPDALVPSFFQLQASFFHSPL